MLTAPSAKDVEGEFAGFEAEASTRPVGAGITNLDAEGEFVIFEAEACTRPVGADITNLV